MARLRSTEEHQEFEARKGRWLFGLVFFVVALLGGLYGWALFNEVDLNPTNLCPVDGEHTPAQYAILIDATDSYDDIQAAGAKKALQRILNQIPKHARLTVFALEKDGLPQLEPGIVLCNPGSGEDLSSWNAAPAWAYEKWETKFVDPLKRHFDGIIKERRAPASPILSQIQAIAINGFEDEPEEKRLYIVSDFIQNEPAYSQYGSDPIFSYQRFRDKGLHDRYAADLAGVAVEGRHIQRPDLAWSQEKKEQHLRFWEDYFRANGAEFESYNPVTH